MIRLLFICIAFCWLPLTAQSTFTSCPSNLEPLVEKLEQTPEAKKLMDLATSEGPIRLIEKPMGASGMNAMWNINERTVILNSSKYRAPGEKMRSILFELQNARTTRHFIELDMLVRKRQLSKNEYIKRVEKLEHNNALLIMDLIDRAITAGYFPPSAKWNIVRNFEEHLSWQKIQGHSALIARNYDIIRSR